MRFTREMFDTMVNELLYSEEVSFDMLCTIAERTLRPAVEIWCAGEIGLRNRKYDDDIMQEIHLRLMKTTVTGFLLRDDVEGPYNNNPEGFQAWLFTVAKNIKRDFVNRIRNRDFKTDPYNDIFSDATTTICGDPEEQQAMIDRLKDAFSVVLSSDISVYKVLTWLAQCVFMLDHSITKIQSTKMIVELFEDKTLFEMYDMLLDASAHIPWIEISEAEQKKISSALRKIHHDNVLYGEIKYRDFFMKQHGEPSGKKSVSDWMNRMNGMIRRGYTEEVPPSSQKKVQSPDRGRAQERREGNGASVS